MTSSTCLLLCTVLLLLETSCIHGYDMTRIHNLGNLKSHTYTLDMDLRVPVSFEPNEPSKAMSLTRLLFALCGLTITI